MPLPSEASFSRSAVLALEVNYHQLLAGSPDAVILFDSDTGLLLDANTNAHKLFGISEAALNHSVMADLCLPQQPDGASSADTIAGYVASVKAGEIRVRELSFRAADGHPVNCEMRFVALPAPHQRYMHARIVDITARVRGDALRAGQGRVLEMLAIGAPLADTLDCLMRLIEGQSDGVLCSVLLLDEDGVTMHPASGPSLPPDYMALLDGVAIGPAVGSCGTAMYRKETVIVTDIMNDPLWAPYKELVRPHGLRACWSTPIYLDKEHILGTFAMYYREVRAPVADDMRLIAVASHLAGIAIERTRRERELNEHREHLARLVDARTTELTAAVQRADQANQELAQTLDHLRLAQEEIVRRNKLAALGNLVAGIAHELNTPIGNSLIVATTLAERVEGIAALAQRGMRRSELDAFLTETDMATGILARNLKRAADLVLSFKQISVDHNSSQRRHFSLASLLEEIIPAMRVNARNQPVNIEFDTEPELAMDSYPGPLAQVIGSLVENCLVHAFPDGARGDIRVRARRLAADTLELSVSDNGIGIAPDIAPRVYDPFFTTKLGSGGSGLGLHIAHNIVTGVLGGRIGLESNVGKGSTFTLLLPARAPDHTAPVPARA